MRVAVDHDRFHAARRAAEFLSERSDVHID
jgi:hypothetical protein